MLGPRIGLAIGPHIGLAVGVGADEVGIGGLVVEGHVFWRGDSNVVGQGTSDHMDNGLGLQNSYSGSTERHYYGVAITNPVSWVDVARRDLQPYDIVGNPAVGPQLSFGRYARLYGGWSTTLVQSTMALNGSTSAHWAPASTSPNNPKNLHNQFLDFADAELAASGKPISAIIDAIGVNNASDNTLTANYASDLAATELALRAKYGASWLYVLVRVNVNMTGGGTLANRNTIRAAQDAFAAAHPTNCIVVNMDRISVSNSALHYTADEQASCGNWIAEKVCEKLRPGRSWDLGSGSAPWVQSYNEPTARSQTSTGDLTVRGPARSRAGDWEYLLIGQGTNAVAPALTTAQGFTAVASVQGVSVFSGSDQYLYLYERRCDQATLDANDGRMPDPVITDNNTSKQALIFSVRNAYQPGAYASAIEAVQMTASNAFSTSPSATGTTTLGANRLVLHLQTGFCGSPNAASAWADATLAGFALLRDSTDDTNETSSIAAGTLAAAGATGTVTGTRAAATLMENAVVAVKPPLGSSDTELTATLTDATDPITGGQNEVYTVQVTNAGANAATSVQVAVTLDSNLVYVSATGTGWSINRVGQVVTCTLASLAVGAASPITITATTPLSTMTITTTAQVTCANASSLSLSQATSVQVTASQDGTSGIYVPADATEWGNLALTAPNFQWGCQDAASPLAAAIGGVTLAAGGSGQTYQDAITGWSRKAVGTQDNTTEDWVSSSASLPDVSATSVLLLLYWKPPAANPAASRRVCLMGTTTTVSVQVSSAGKPILFAGANNGTATNAVTGSSPIPLVVKYNRTGSESKLFTLNEKLSVAFSGTATGKQVLLGGAGVAAQNEFLYAALWTGAAAEMSDATIKSMLQTLGWAPSWT